MCVCKSKITKKKAMKFRMIRVKTPEGLAGIVGNNINAIYKIFNYQNYIRRIKIYRIVHICISCM